MERGDGPKRRASEAFRGASARERGNLLYSTADFSRLQLLSGRIGLMELLTAIAAVLAAVGSLVAAVGVLIVNGKLDKLIGRVQALETSHNAHVNAPGLHS